MTGQARWSGSPSSGQRQSDADPPKAPLPRPRALPRCQPRPNRQLVLPNHFLAPWKPTRIFERLGPRSRSNAHVPLVSEVIEWKTYLSGPPQRSKPLGIEFVVSQ
jgi:hypothetical protein